MTTPITVDAHGQAWRGNEPLDLRFSAQKLSAIVADRLRSRFDSASDIARRAGISPGKLGDLMAGRCEDPGCRRVARLVAVLGCEFADLLE